MFESLTFDAQLSLFRKLYQSAAVSASASAPSENALGAAQPTLSAPRFALKPVLASRARLSEEERRALYSASALVTREARTLKAIGVAALIRAGNDRAIGEIELCWNAFASNDDRFEFLGATLRIAFREASLERYFAFESALATAVGARAAATNDWPAQLDAFLLSLLNCESAVDVAYRAAKAEKGSNALARLALSALACSPRALRLAVKVGHGAALREIAAIDRSAALASLFVEEAKLQFSKLTTEKAKNYSKEKAKRRFSPFLIGVSMQPKLVRNLVESADRIPSLVLNELFAKLETLFSSLKEKKLSETAMQIIELFRENRNSKIIVDLLRLLAQTRNRNPKIYSLFISELTALLDADRFAFLAVAAQLDVGALIDALLARYASTEHFDAALVSDVLQSARLTPNAFLTNFALLASANERFELGRAFADGFAYLYSAQLSAAEFVEAAMARVDGGVPPLALHVALCLAEEQRRRGRPVDAFVPLLRRAMAGGDEARAEFWAMAVRAHDLDEVLFRESVAVELVGSRRAEFFERLAKHKRGDRFE